LSFVFQVDALNCAWLAMMRDAVPGHRAAAKRQANLAIYNSPTVPDKSLPFIAVMLSGNSLYL